MCAQSKPRKMVITRDQAISLLYPIAAFFNKVGMSRSQSLAALTAAIDDVCGPAGKRLEQIGTPTYYADVIAAWSRERRFLDSRGRPRALTLSGANGFAALVKTACAVQDPKRLLSVLIRYKNVRRLKNGRFQLVSPFFRATAGSKVAFEPVAYFLNDVTVALTHMLRNSRTAPEARHFWRRVESARISPHDAKKFVAFARERSLMFLEDLDDWLLSHSDNRSRCVAKNVRVGLGLFSIYSH